MKAIAILARAVLASLMATQVAARSDVKLLPPASDPDAAVAYQLNPGHSGSIQMSVGFSTKLKQAWSVSINENNSGIAYPVIADGLVFASGITSDHSVTYAFDLKTGATKWSKTFKSSPPPLTYDNGLLFAQTFGGLLTAFQAKSGEVKWTIQLPDAAEFAVFPTAVDGHVYTAGDYDGGYLYSVNESLGSLDWELFGTDTGESSPAYGDKGLYVADPCQYYKFNPKNGNLEWHVDDGCHGGGSINPVSFNKRVYTQWIQDNLIHNSKNGAIVGSFAGYLPPAFFTDVKGHAFGVSVSNEGLTCWKVSTGTTAWTFKATDLSTPAIVVNGYVIVGSVGGKVYLFDSKKGRLLWTGDVVYSVSSLAAGDGALVVGSANSVTAFVPQ